MADGNSGQKGIKNSLLSGATSTNFFEDAALLVPVPIVGTGAEASEPATAEIDLNSDDSSSNRGSVEKEMVMLDENEHETSPPPSVEDKEPAVATAAPISLFSRATTGMDAFTRMLAGSSSSSRSDANKYPPSSNPNIDGDVETTPAVVELTQGLSSPGLTTASITPPAPLSTPFTVSSLFTSQKPPTGTIPPFITSPTTTAMTSLPATMLSTATVLPTPKQPPPTTGPATAIPQAPAPVSSQSQFVPASSLFSSGSGGATSQLFETGHSANPLVTPLPFTTAGVSPMMPPSTASVFSPGMPPVPNTSPSVITPGVTPSTTNISPIPFVHNPHATISPTTQTGPPLPPTAMFSPTTGNPPSMSTPTSLSRQPTLTNVPLTPLPVTGSLMSPPSSSTPPVASGGSNTFRLGGQRLRYAACPDIQSAPTMPIVGPPAAANPLNMPTMIDPSPSSTNISTAFTPSFEVAAQPSPSITSVALPPKIDTVKYGPPPSSHQPPVNMFSAGSSYPPSTSVAPPPPSSAFAPMVPQELQPLSYHWFYRKDVDGKPVWKPFSVVDSAKLEQAFNNSPDSLVATDGGRYDVCVKSRTKKSVYWDEAPIEVRRGSWFFKGPMDNRFVPYDEEFAAKLESEYVQCSQSGNWQRRLEFPGGETVIIHNAGVVVHFCQAAAPDDWGNLPESQIRPRVVKRGVEEVEVEEPELEKIDYLVFVVHGIGPICDFKLRNIVEAVDDFRGLSLQLMSTHFLESIEKGLVGRVEFLPVSWHKALHGDKGIDEQLKRITLRSIPKFRDFTNDTLLDILFYTSPIYCQTIMNSVSSELNRLYKLFLSRNPNFNGKVSLAGHSLGSLILFDLLSHQPLPAEESASESDAETNPSSEVESDVALDATPVQSSQFSYMVGTAGTGQHSIKYPKLNFAPSAFFALGSPIAMFVTVRGIEKLGSDFKFPTCPSFFNIFHPYDPVAYRIETLIDPAFQSRPVLIPHHKGRKRIHLELKETMARVGADIKHRVIDAVRNTVNTVYHYAGFNKAQDNLENEIQSAIVNEIEKSEADNTEDENVNLRIGSLNGGRRIDYVLQEAPYETFNEYVFAMSTHVGYWESEDTMLLILTEIYAGMGIQKDSQPQHMWQSSGQGMVSPTGYSQQPGPPVSLTAAVTQAYAPPMNNSTYQPTAPPYSEYGKTFGGDGNSKNGGGLYPALSTAYNNIQQQHQQTSSHAVPMIPSLDPPAGTLLPPTPMISMPAAGSIVGAPLPTSNVSPTGGRGPVIGNRPVAEPSQFARGMDPTAPMLTMSQMPPPPKMGFVPKLN